MVKWEPEKIRLGVSACLLGDEVRYDGGHKRDAFLVDTLGPFVEWVPVCPEVELGLGIPRDTLRLVAGPRGPDLVVQRTGRALTEEMNAFSAERVMPRATTSKGTPCWAQDVRSSVSSAERLISTGNSLPSLRRAANCMPAPIGRGAGSVKYRVRCPGCRWRACSGMRISMGWPSSSARV